jgi:hypothetical protein
VFDPFTTRVGVGREGKKERERERKIPFGFPKIEHSLFILL